MKNLKYIISIILLVSLIASCNEDEWLKEIPLDKYSPENMFINQDQFKSAIAKVYSDIALVTYITGPEIPLMVGGLADNLYHFYDPSFTNTNLYKMLIPEGTLTAFFWKNYYRLIYDANVIIERIDEAEFSSEKARITIKAEAYFFRAFAYKNLAILYGDVPLILKENKQPRRDFVRASREDVLKQVVTDLQFAADNLPEVAELAEDGRLTKAAANHVLAETYLIQKEWDKAIAAASEVINNPNYALMTSRFGAWKDKPGDVFRDLFIRNNQNRRIAGGAVNTEGIWVHQFEYNKPGGGTSPMGTRFYGVQYWSLTGKDNRNLFFNHSSQNGGRGFGFHANNDYLNYTIWEDDWNDMRNSEHNIRRDMVADNPASAYFGQKIVESNAIATPGPYNEFWRPYWAKLVPFGNFPPETIANQATGATLNTAHSSYTDHYLIRLSETYLLRAEAHLGKQRADLAAADINVVRARANATPVLAGDVDIDYILDERSRELNYEELRVLTLMRLGKWNERVKKYNPYYNGKYASFPTYGYHNVWPIPQSEIERNTEAVLEQNPGY